MVGLLVGFQRLCYDPPSRRSGHNSVVECQLPKLKVVGSNPIARSRQTPYSYGFAASSPEAFFSPFPDCVHLESASTSRRMADCSPSGVTWEYRRSIESVL